MKLAAEVLAYAAFALIVAVFSASPPYQRLAYDEAIVSLAFSHAGRRVSDCRQLTQAELDELPPNMRRPIDCPRARHPVRLVFKSGDRLLYSAVLEPSGIWSDGKASVYERIRIGAGEHRLFVGMNDSGGQAFDYSHSQLMRIEPGRNVVIRFDPLSGQFSIR